MPRNTIWCALLAATSLSLSVPVARADDQQVARGQYLVTIAGCNDCHTPGYFLGKPDMDRYLGGSDVAFEIPGVGAFVPRNITPDKETGIGNWSVDQIVHTLQTGERPDGRVLATIMPWQAFSKLTKDDVTAVAMFLKSIKPVKHAVPGPFGPGETVPTFLFRVVPPGATVAQAPGK